MRFVYFQNAGLQIEVLLTQAESPLLYFMLPISMLASESSPLVYYIVYCGRGVLGVGHTVEGCSDTS